jgi:hypothetical protein
MVFPAVGWAKVLLLFFKAKQVLRRLRMTAFGLADDCDWVGGMTA